MTIETKYNIGDEVWFLTSKAVQAKVVGLIFEARESFIKDELSYFVKNDDWISPILLREFQLFPTKEELLKSL